MNDNPKKPSYVCGLDLGQQADFTALAIIELAGDLFLLRHLERVRQIPYTDIVKRVSLLLGKEPLKGNSSLAIDKTGVGAAVVDLFLEASPCPIIPVIITAGNQASCVNGEYHVPKVDLVGAVQAAGGTGRLKYSPSLPFASILDTELLNFRVKISESAHASYNARDGEHDDLLLAVSLALYFADRPEPGFFFAGGWEGAAERFLRGD